MINAKKIRASILRAINQAPVVVTILRDTMKDDGCGGSIPDEIGVVVGEITAVFDNSSTSTWETTSSDGGIVRKAKSAQLITLVDEQVNIRTDDYFAYKGVKYVLDKPANLMELGIAWTLPIKQELYSG